MAANQYINLYKNNPTEGALDGVLVSLDGEQSNPVEVVLDVGEFESKNIKLGLRCENRWKAAPGAVITAVNDDKTNWLFAKNETDEFKKSLIFEDEITTTNTICFVKVKSDAALPKNDRSVVLQLKAMILVNE